MAKTRARNKQVPSDDTGDLTETTGEGTLTDEVTNEVVMPDNSLDLTNSGTNISAIVGQLLNLTVLLDKPVDTTTPPAAGIDIPSSSTIPSLVTDLGIGTKSWSTIAKPKQGMSLHFCDTSADTKTVVVEEDDVIDEIKFWQNTLMGNFLGSKPKIKEVDEYVLKYWKNTDRPIVQYYKKGWYTFRFLSERDMNEILKGGPWNMGTSTLVLKQWTPTFSKEMDSVSTVPTWVLFLDLDPFMWSEKVLSKMASVAGKPLFADPPTTYKSKLSVARVPVEVDVAGDLPTAVQLHSPYHGETTQRIIYEWLPHYCHCCRKLGHTKEKCKFTKLNNKIDALKSKKVTQIYKPVQHSETQDSGSNLLGHSSLKLGEGSVSGDVVTDSECPELGSSPTDSKVVLLPNDVGTGSGCKVLGPTSSAAVVTGDQTEEALVVRRHEHSGISIHNSYSVLHTEGDMEEGRQVEDNGEPPDPGDFNIVRAMEERIGLNPPSLTKILAFNQCLLDNNLDDVQRFGCEHTWTNKRDVEARYPHTQVIILPSGISDHSPLLVQIKEAYQIKNKFSYLNYWEEHKDYGNIVAQARDMSIRGNAMFKLFAKSKNVRKQLIGLHKTSYSGLSIKVRQAKHDLDECQKQVQGAPLDPHLLEKEKDAPNSYFFAKIAVRRNQSIISKINDRGGNLREGITEVNAAFVDYYQCLLGGRVEIIDLPIEYIEGPRIQESNWPQLCRPVEEMDIKKALFSIDSNNSPGQDGFSS
ncbi:uncharacterized protein LOC141613909 [Silene latifolia]|uniref:uncharacterized protein LOC141613909 n=1 Tax=Silene latifolia TaxID=37657 RepID=UPI003D76AFD2